MFAEQFGQRFGRGVEAQGFAGRAEKVGAQMT